MLSATSISTRVLLICSLSAALVVTQDHSDYSFDPALAEIARTGAHHNADTSAQTIKAGHSQEEYDDYAIFDQGLEHDISDSKTDSLDDIAGDYEFEQPTRSSCKNGSDGKPILDGAFANLCQVQITVVDALVRAVPGGVDGVYAFHSCHGDRPSYLRISSPPHQDRLLWYSTRHKAWDLSNGTDANQEKLLLYGGEASAHLQPEYVKDTWFVKSNFDPVDPSNGDFEPANITVECAGHRERFAEKDSKVTSEKLPNPYMTQSEMDKEYRSAIQRSLLDKDKAAARASTRNRLGTLVGLFVAVLAVLFFLPRCLERRLRSRRPGNAGAWFGLVPIGSKQSSS